jgi:hypothetical protein
MELAGLQRNVPPASSGSKGFSHADCICNERRRIKQAQDAADWTDISKDMPRQEEMGDIIFCGSLSLLPSC